MTSLLTRLARDRRGVSAVEFALISPLLCLILAAAVDLGGALMTKYRLNAALAAAINYAQVNAASVTTAGAPALATTLAALVQTSQGASWANGTVTVNNGSTATVVAGATTTGGTAANAALCYCPTGTPGAFTWGSAVACGSVGTGVNTGYAGKFVTITASRTYTPLLTTYGMIRNPITASATAQVQ